MKSIRGKSVTKACPVFTNNERGKLFHAIRLESVGTSISFNILKSVFVICRLKQRKEFFCPTLCLNYTRTFFFIQFSIVLLYT